MIFSARVVKMNKIQFATSNILSILKSADLTALRFILPLAAFSSTIWFVVMLSYGMTIQDIESTRRLMFEVFTFSEWSGLILIYGILNILLVSFKFEYQTKRTRSINILVSSFGALLWSLNASLLLAAKLEQGALTLMVAQWILAIVAWWIFIRDCYGR